ncbi:hypothetical protein C8R45DRAFT_1214704 [Mycena sanguinolenta]|nr:hypothetical protein C8R45DRAFT_1214704 [Mycena sanguinolenta]
MCADLSFPASTIIQWYRAPSSQRLADWRLRVHHSCWRLIDMRGPSHFTSFRCIFVAHPKCLFPDSLLARVRLRCSETAPSPSSCIPAPGAPLALVFLSSARVPLSTDWTRRTPPRCVSISSLYRLWSSSPLSASWQTSTQLKLIKYRAITPPRIGIAAYITAYVQPQSLTTRRAATLPDPSPPKVSSFVSSPTLPSPRKEAVVIPLALADPRPSTPLRLRNRG